MGLPDMHKNVDVLFYYDKRGDCRVMSVIQVFKRVEKKYLLSTKQYEQLREELLLHMSEDSYGLHTICNIYYDTVDCELIRTSLEKPKYKEKFRVRSYGVPSKDDIIFLEIKKKYNGVVYKRRIPLAYKDAMEVVESITTGKKLFGNNIGEYDVLQSYENKQILHEIEYIINHYQLIPNSYIAYDRIALFGIDEPELRITFDRNVRTRDTDLDLAMGDYGDVILDDGYYLMEIKTNGAMPMWLVSKLSEMELYPYSFSKYGTAHKMKVLEGLNNVK